jgi:hypothetical protein
MSTRENKAESVKTDLEIEEDLPLHEKGWRVQRGGWIFIFVLTVAAAFGVFGDGLASKKTLRDDGTLVEYDRFYRHEARMELKIHLENSGSDTAHVSFTNNYLKDFKIESILPEPGSSRVQGGRVHYFFDGNGPMDITFYCTPRAFGTTDGRIGIGNKEYPISHFIYP